ncbi:hypothetical protein [Streptomyces sp. bgisy022]|uniref:hypothetical protein n=1 Tax=Streptomyces sp. bgisy022 TaxID=3413769 RepID=UPI003D72482C
MITDCARVQAPKSSLPGHLSEDAAHTALPARGRAGETRLVVADGGSGSADSGWWARQLTRDLCAAPGRAFADSRAFHDVVALAALRWPSRRRVVLGQGGQSAFQQWLTARRTEDGPSTALLGVRLLPPPGPAGGMWQLVSVGDSCLFQVRADRPVESVARLPRVPHLVRVRGVVPAPGLVLREGSWERGDVFYLMTDALARWWVRRIEDGGRPWATADELCAAPDRFADWVRDQRDRRALQDDDVTLLRAECRP